MKQLKKSQLKEGIKVEHEHTATIRTLQGKGREYSVDKAARLIAEDHLREMPDYYTKLKIMEVKRK